MNKNLNKRIYPIAKADGFSLKITRNKKKATVKIHICLLPSKNHRNGFI